MKSPSILRLSAPLVVSFWLRSAFAWIDTIFAARLEGLEGREGLGDASIAAIGLAVPFEFLTIACWVGASNGLTTRLAAAMGAGEDGKKAWFTHWVHTTFGPLELRLENNPGTGRYCHGETPTLADICLYAQVWNNRRFEVDGFRCGIAICHEWRYPEVYREYARLGADVVLHAWYDGGYDDEAWEREGQDLAEVIPATVRGHAVCNHLWGRATPTLE